MSGEKLFAPSRKIDETQKHFSYRAAIEFTEYLIELKEAKVKREIEDILREKDYLKSLKEEKKVLDKGGEV